MTQRTDLLTPVGRLIAGSLYKPNTTDAEGKPLVVKSGVNAGQARLDYYFMLAIPKTAGKQWWDEPWGQIIFKAGATGFPQAYQSPTFAWKVKDGDSAIPNRKGKKPCDMEGARGHWLVSFSSGYPPEVTRDNGTVVIHEPNAVKLGHFVQVFGSVGDNGSQSQPGVFINHSKVNFAAFGPEISVGISASEVGFGQGVVLPAGASMTPPAGSFNPGAGAGLPQMPGAPGMPAMPGAPVMTPGMPAMPGAPVMTPGMPAMPAMPGATPGMPAMPAATAVQPHPGFLAPPLGAPAMPSPPAARQMTAKAQGTYEQYIGAGWNDAQLIQNGFMVA